MGSHGGSLLLGLNSWPRWLYFLTAVAVLLLGLDLLGLGRHGGYAS